ncbi:MAG: 1-deoxy-D-xylulose-5-phosphate reductoisomerase [Deltaproteobacteria bacterium]|nr:1-deoxy-D-xylulose-5-phosphate reductoisomerase [Deltaproteobacteria bacterium]
MKNLSILGATGSIGRNAVKIVEMFPDKFHVKALAAKNNIAILAQQIQTVTPDIAVVFDPESARELKAMLPTSVRTEILWGESGYHAAATLDGVDQLVMAMVGSAGLKPTLAAIDAGKDVALANKETLVMAGDVVMSRAADKQVRIFPVDSEHSAIFQCMEGHRRQDLDKIILTASGGPFLNRPAGDFAGITPADALAHPTWQMGKKISIDSATLMNKGLEVIEACWLFDLAEDQIDVLIHPQSVIHSMVSFRDGAILAQLGVPDMTGAIAYALSYPKRLDLQQPLPDFAKIGALTFDEPDYEKFPCLALAFEAMKIGKTMPAVLNAANEAAVGAFLNEQISFHQIPEIIRSTMNRHEVIQRPELTDILDADLWAGKAARQFL